MARGDEEAVRQAAKGRPGWAEAGGSLWRAGGRETPNSTSLASAAARVEGTAWMRRRPPQGQRKTSVPKVRWCSVAQSRRRFLFFVSEGRGSDGVGAAQAAG